MSKDSRHIGFRASLGVVSLTFVAALIGSGGSEAGSQANLVRVVSPADFIIQPNDPNSSTVKLDFEFDKSVSYVMLTSYDSHPFKLFATSKTLTWGPCGPGAPNLRPGDKVPMHYDAFDSAGAKIGSGSWEFTIGPDTAKPTVRIVSPKNNSFVGQGETVEIVVAGEESKSATTWQTGIHRLTLVEPAPAMNIQNSDETATSACDAKQWTRQHSFRYMVPRDAQSGQVLTLKAAAEDGAKNIGFASPNLNLIVQQGYAGLWTAKGHVKTDQCEVRYTIEAAFSFTFRVTGAVECGTASRPYCGSASVTFGQGHGKDSHGQDCVFTRTQSSSVFKIRVTGIHKGNELTHLNFQKIENVPNSWHWVCPKIQYDEPSSDPDPGTGSILPEGITITLPLRGSTTVTKHESFVDHGIDVDHHVEIYAPRQNR
jgi:hypothetical protein